jgi:hypothetical protein
LRSHADYAPTGAGLLDAVRARSRRRRRRWYAAVAGAAVLVIAVGAAGTPVLYRALTGTASGPLARPVDEAARATAAPVELVPPTYRLPAFPFTPGWEPGGIGAPFVGLSDEEPWGGMWLQYPRLHPGEPFYLGVGKAEPTYLASKMESTSQEPVTVRSRPATLLRNDNRTDKPVALIWQERPGEWVMVIGSHPVDAEGVVRYANELKAEPMPVRPPFTFDLVPSASSLAILDQNMMDFVGVGSTANYVTGRLTVELSRAERHDGATATMVNGRDAEIVDDNGLMTLYVHLDAGRMLAVRSGGVLAMSGATLLRFAAGIRVMPEGQLR